MTGATLLTVALSQLQATGGTGAFGVSITGGDIGIAVLTAPTPSSGTDSRYWLAVTGSGLGGSIDLGGQVTATVAGLAVAINTTGGVGTNGLGSSPLDWTKDISLDGGTTFGATVDPGANLLSPPSPSIAIVATAGGFSLSGSLTGLNVFNILTGSANFAVSESKVAVAVGTTKLAGATLLTVGLSNLSASASSGAFGLSVSGGDLGIALLERLPPLAAPRDNRYWIAVTATNLSASLNLGSNITATVSSITAQINQAGGRYASGSTSIPATPLNWTTSLDLNGDGAFGGAGDLVDPGVLLLTPTAPVTMPIPFTAPLLALRRIADGLNIYNLITGSANFAMSQTTVNAKIGGTTLTGATLLTVGLSDLQAGTGTAGFGLTVSGGDIGIAVLEAPTPATGTDTRYWLAVNGSNLAATLSLGGLPHGRRQQRHDRDQPGRRDLLVQRRGRAARLDRGPGPQWRRRLRRTRATRSTPARTCRRPYRCRSPSPAASSSSAGP